MEIGITLGVLFIIIIGLVIYTMTKKYRESRERILIHSSEFQALNKLGFKTKRVGDKTIYLGEYNKYSFAVFIDSDDLMARTNFSIVFSVVYKKFDKETFKKLNTEYYNRFKSLILNSENLFFYEDFAQFSYPNSTLKIPKNKILKKLNFITELLKKEKLIPRVMTDLKSVISRDY